MNGIDRGLMTLFLVFLLGLLGYVLFELIRDEYRIDEMNACLRTTIATNCSTGG